MALLFLTGASNVADATQKPHVTLFVAMPTRDTEWPLRRAIRAAWASTSVVKVDPPRVAYRFFMDERSGPEEDDTVILDDPTMTQALQGAPFAKFKGALSGRHTSHPHASFGSCGTTRWTDISLSMGGWALRYYDFEWFLRLDKAAVLCTKYG